MKVLINISPLRGLHHFRGIGVYTKLLVQALQKYDQENEYILTTKTNATQADLIHYPFFDFYFLTLPLISLKPTVVTIHDTIPLIYPEHYSPGIRGTLKFYRQKFCLKQVKAVITDSNTSKTDIVNYLGISDEKVHRVYLAANPVFQPQPYQKQQHLREQFNLKKPYLLYVGDINYNKNIEFLLDAVADYAKEVDLVLVSRALAKDIPETRKINKRITELKIGQAIKIITSLHSDEDLAALYSGALWYVHPSLYEGFGFPVLEAMQCGAPVISSTGGSLPEVTGTATLQFDPLNLETLKREIAKVLMMTKSKRQSYINAGFNQAKQFSWEKTAKQTIDVYKKVLNK